MADPGLIAQGVGAAALNGGMGIFFAMLLLIANVLIAGLAILILRFIASWGGPFSNIFGRRCGYVCSLYGPRSPSNQCLGNDQWCSCTIGDRRFLENH